MEGRNYTGVQLIDRNDELCILYEKANIQEQTLKKGEISLTKKEDSLRTLRLQLAELQRQIEVTRKHIPNMPEYAAKILSSGAAEAGRLSRLLRKSRKPCQPWPLAAPWGR